ncbi:MAG: outer membrane protein assembly factor BamB family protein, partial [Planctomycetota bacterium]
GTLHAIAQSDGSDTWKLDLVPPAQQDVAHGNPSLVLVGSDLVALVGSKLFVINPDKQRITADRPVSGREGMHYRLLADRDAVIMFIGRDVACYALGSLEPQWRLSDAVDLSRADRAALHDGGLYFDSRGFFADSIQKIDVDTGELAWSHKTVVSIESSFGFYKNQVLFAGGSKLVAVDHGTGLETWRVELSRSLNRQGHGEIPPAVAEGACLLVAEDPEAIVAVDLKTRQELWTCPITLGEFCFVDGPPQPAGQDLLIIAASGARCHFVAAIGPGSGDARLAKASD